MKYRENSARLAMQDGNGDAREGFTRRNMTNRNVRRRLFVDDDDDNERPENRQGLDENRTNELFEEARNNLVKAKERWNFDFETETPLPGNYVWVKLDKDGKEVPSIVNKDSQETFETNSTEDCKLANQTSSETNEENRG